MNYTVGICYSAYDRGIDVFVTAENVPKGRLAEEWKAAYDRIQRRDHPGIRRGGVVVFGPGYSPREAWEQRFAQTYKFDKAGRKRRRYPVPQIEKDWIAWAKAERKRALEERQDRKMQGGIIRCEQCGHRWSAMARDYGLVHECGQGLVKE